MVNLETSQYEDPLWRLFNQARYAWWLLRSVIKLEAPVPVQGKQGIWRCDVE